MKYNNVIFLGLCLGLTTYSALSADSVIKISGRVLDYGCTVSSDSLNFTVDVRDVHGQILSTVRHSTFVKTAQKQSPGKSRISR